MVPPSHFKRSLRSGTLRSKVLNARLRGEVRYKKRGEKNMASAKFQGGKYHNASEVKAHFRHDDISVQSRKIAARTNPNIDISKSPMNRALLGLTYKQLCKKYDERIALLDSTTNSNKRKDRVTLQNIEIPVPKDLERCNYNSWFIKVAEILIAFYGKDNFMDGQIHYDEEHEYIDAQTNESIISRVHAHFSIVPEIDGVLNAKQMVSRTAMKKLNQAIEKMTIENYGCSFMTGEKKKSVQTVEELKTLSERKRFAQREKAILEAEKKLSDKEKILDERMALLTEYTTQGENFYNGAYNLFLALSRESQDFQEEKQKLYGGSFSRLKQKQVELNESLLPHSGMKKEKQKSL